LFFLFFFDLVVGSLSAVSKARLAPLPPEKGRGEKGRGAVYSEEQGDSFG